MITLMKFLAQEHFVFKDIEKIKKAGLARGGSLDNAIVVDEDKILNKGLEK